MVGLAIIVPLVLMEILEIRSQLISMRMYQSAEQDRLALWLRQYGIIIILLSVAIRIACAPPRQELARRDVFLVARV